MSALEFEIEERESAVDVDALLADVVPTRRCACGDVRLGDEVAHRDDVCRPMTGLHRVVERAAFPAPLVTSRDPWDGSGCPATVTALAQRAVERRWGVRVQRSRGCAPHATHGAPGAVKWRYAVSLARPGRGAYAVHDGAAWKSIMVWGHDRPWFPHGSVTDLAEYIDAGGIMDSSWYVAIRDRLIAADQRKRERQECDRGVHSLPRLETLGPVRGEWCERCGKTWALNGEPWRKTKKGSGEAL